MTQQEIYENAVNVALIPQPPKYHVQLRGHSFNLTKAECIKLYQKLLNLLPYEKETALETLKIAVSRIFRVSVRQINSPSRIERVVVARHAAIWLAKRLGIRHEEIAESFGRHYSSSSYGIKSIERRMDRQPELRAKLESVEAQLKELIGHG